MIKGSLPRELEKSFRRKAMERYGYSKGAVSKALEAAVKLWLMYDYEPTDEEEANNRAFESMREELEANYREKYVTIAGGKLTGIHGDLEEAVKVNEGEYTHRIIFKIGDRPTQRVRLGWRVVARPAGRT